MHNAWFSLILAELASVTPLEQRCRAFTFGSMIMDGILLSGLMGVDLKLKFITLEVIGCLSVLILFAIRRRSFRVQRCRCVADRGGV